MAKLSVIILGQNVADEVIPAFVTSQFADEIIFQQSEYRQRGGKFAMLLPEPRVIL